VHHERSALCGQQDHRRGGKICGRLRGLHAVLTDTVERNWADMRQTIDAAAFQQMVIHAAAAISAEKQQVNDLNVFPVPDGDTGTSRSLTIAAAAGEMKNTHCDTVGQAAQATASALLRGARGNSGVILSLLFRGFAKAIKDRETMDGRDLAIALDFGVA